MHTALVRNIETIPRSVLPQISTTRQRPIELQTENGFAVIRGCDTDGTSAAGTKHWFIVRDPDGFELEITVEFSKETVAELTWRSRNCLRLESSFWLVCAERHLADYLWENDDYPPDASLIIEEPNIDDLELAMLGKRLRARQMYDYSRSNKCLM